MIGVAVIGIGKWGRNHVRVYRELQLDGEVGKVNICDPNESHVHEVSRTLEVESVTDYRQILKDPEIHAVNIATPSNTHYQIAKDFLQAGKDILVEKPMTLNAGEAPELISIAESTNCILMSGHLFRYHPAVRELKRMICAGDLGTIHNIVSFRMALGIPRDDMGVIYALGIHELDLFCYLLGVDYPDSLTAVSSTTYRKEIEETAMISMDFGKAKGFALESWLIPAYGKLRDLVVVGSEKSVRIDYLNPGELHLFNAKIVLSNGTPVRVDNEGEYIVSIPYAEPLKEELKHFISCVNTRQKPLSDGLVGLRAVIMAEAALTSARTNRAVDVP